MTPAEYQRRQKVIELGDRFISYIDEGHGPGDPIVLLHGIPTWGYLWHELIPLLARSRRVLVPDLLGYGYSDKADEFDRSLTHQTEALVEWALRLGITRAAWIGHDLGGGVALRLATLFPDKVSRIALLNTVCYDSWPSELLVQLGHPAVHRRFSADAVVRLLKRALFRGFSIFPSEELLAALAAPYATEVGKLSLIRNAAALNTNQTMEIGPLLSRIDVPVLILWGEDDKSTPIKYAERLRQEIPTAALVRLSDTHHFMMFDRRDDVADHLMRFLNLERTAAADLQIRA